MTRFGLIGKPVSHSKSPDLFRAAYPDCGMTYELIEAPSFEESIRLFKEGFDAVNVTAPYKESAFLCADSADIITSLLRATNLLLKKDGRICAFNTDFWAVSNILRLYLHEFEKPAVLVAGCGGAGKAAALAASDLHLDVTVVNRSYDRAKSFCDAVGGIKAEPFDQMAAVARKSDIIIYTLPVKADCFDSVLLEGKMVLEANYRNPSFSPLKADVDFVYVPGYEWLVQQALTGFGIMTGRKPEEKSLRALLKHLHLYEY